MVIGGQVLGEKVNSYEELLSFVFSKKVLKHIRKAYKQGGKVVFLDITHTFASIFHYLLSTTKGVDLSFYKAFNNAVNFAKSNEEKLPVVVVTSISSYEHQTTAFVVPMPLQLIQSLEK